jgi:DNA invertase Pin-like site-specific DNA recombinase
MAIDTATPQGKLFFSMVGAFAEFERAMISERVKAGMDRARRQGRRIGRPRLTDRRGFLTRYKSVLERLSDGSLSRRKAAKELGIGYASLKRLLDAGFGTKDEAA